MNGELHRRVAQLTTLMELSSLITSTLDTQEIRRRAIEAATTLVQAETGSLLLVDPHNGELFFEVALGDTGEILKEIRLARGQGIAGWVAEQNQPLIINDTLSDPRFFRDVDRKSAFETRNMVCVPVRTKDHMLGVLEAINKKEGLFDEQDRDVLSALANQVATAVENANLYRELKETFYDTSQALAETIEKRDPYTGGHTQRVMNYSVEIGQMMGLSGEVMEALRLAAILHDIGKIGVRDSILLKSDRLDREEALIMNRHAEFGSEILSHVRKLSHVIPGVRGHHERYDGTGYPDGLRGDEIPLIARVIAVADTFDAMTTDRPYRKAMDAKTAVNELLRHSGTQFDGEIVGQFVRCMESSMEAS